MSTGNPTVTQTGVYKAIDDAWIGLLILSILIFILSLVGLVVLLILWKRFAKQKQLLKGNETFTSTNNMTQPANSSTSRRPVPVHHIEEYPSTNYETQRMEVFVPPNDDDLIEENFGRIQTRFNPDDGVEQVRQYHQRATKAYF